MKSVLVALDPVTTSLASHPPTTHTLTPSSLCHTTRPLPVTHSVLYLPLVPIMLDDLVHQPEVLRVPLYHCVLWVRVDNVTSNPRGRLHVSGRCSA